MSTYRQKEIEFNFTTVLDFLVQYRKPIIIITLAAGLLAYIFSSPLFITPKYKSTAVFFATTTNSISKALMSDVPMEKSKSDILAPGAEEEAEQLLQYLQSDRITNRVIQKYHLMRHYHIDPQSSYPYTKLVKKFNENVTYRRTEYTSLEINVLDESPDTAAMIANDILALVDSTKNETIRVRAQEGLKIVEQSYKEKQKYISALVDSLSALGKMGVPNYTVQGNTLDQEYARALTSNNTRAIAELKHKAELSAIYSPIQKSFLDRIEFETKELSLLHDKYEQAKVDAEKFLPSTFVVNKAGPAEKKYYPVRSVIVGVSMISALGLSILFFAFLNNYQEYRRTKKIREAVESSTLVVA